MKVTFPQLTELWDKHKTAIKVNLQPVNMNVFFFHIVPACVKILLTTEQNHHLIGIK